MAEIIVTFVVPTYNRAYIIERAINSIKKQTFNGWECIIVDDGSTDNSFEIIGNYIKDDERFSFIVNTRTKGAPGARNTGILASHGEFIVLFDSDNVMHPEFLEKVYEQLTKEDVDICSSYSRIIDETTGNPIGSFSWEGYGHVHNAVLGEKSYFDNSSTLIRKQKLYDIGLLDEKCPSFQEWDTHIRLSKISTYTTFKEELIDYYRGGADTISKGLLRSLLGRMYILKKHRKDFLSHNLLAYIRDYLGVYNKLTKLRDSGEKEVSYKLINYFKDDAGEIIYFIVKSLSLIIKK